MLNIKRMLTKLAEQIILSPITVTPSLGTLIANYSCKVGRLYFINCRIDGVTASTGTTTIGTFSSSQAPTGEAIMFVQTPAVTNTFPSGWVTGDGKLRISIATAMSSTSVRVFAFYYK